VVIYSIQLLLESFFKIRTICAPCSHGPLTGGFRRSRAVVNSSATSLVFAEPLSKLVAVSQCFIKNHVNHHIVAHSSYVNRRFERTYHLYLQDRKLAEQETSVRKVPSYRREDLKY
jgi:hypothetical protein